MKDVILFFFSTNQICFQSRHNNNLFLMLEVFFPSHQSNIVFNQGIITIHFVFMMDVILCPWIKIVFNRGIQFQTHIKKKYIWEGWKGVGVGCCCCWSNLTSGSQKWYRMWGWGHLKTLYSHDLTGGWGRVGWGGGVNCWFACKLCIIISTLNWYWVKKKLCAAWALKTVWPNSSLFVVKHGLST